MALMQISFKVSWKHKARKSFFRVKAFGEKYFKSKQQKPPPLTNFPLQPIQNDFSYKRWPPHQKYNELSMPYLANGFTLHFYKGLVVQTSTNSQSQHSLICLETKHGVLRNPLLYLISAEFYTSSTPTKYMKLLSRANKSEKTKLANPTLGFPCPPSVFVHCKRLHL
jgi:hypothetical protein